MICFVEDDVNIRELVVYTLENTGKQARGFENVKALYSALEFQLVEKPELLLLDIMLPDEDGAVTLKKIRSGHLCSIGLEKELPVIMLTAKNAEVDKVRFLEAGADDYVVKPFGMMELVARVRAVLRRSKNSGAVKDDSLFAGNITLNTSAWTVTVSGKRIELTTKEFELLRVLLENKPAVLSRDRLLDLVWGYEFSAETRTVDVHIKTLRQKLAAGGASQEYIETIRGVGYRLNPDCSA